jgi:integrase
MALKVKQIEAARPEKTIRMPVGAGLYLKITAQGERKTFEARPKIAGRRTWVSLGTFPALSLAEARALCAVVLSEIERGTETMSIRAALTATKDPSSFIEVARRGVVLPVVGRGAVVPKRASGNRVKAPDAPVDTDWTQKLHARMTFREAASLWFPWKASTLSNGKHVNQIWTTLDIYAFPAIGNRAIGEITKSDVVSMLRPIWGGKRVTAKRTLGRVREIFANVAITGIRPDNPGEIDTRAVFSTVGHRVNHFNALDWTEVPDLIDHILDHPPLAEETRQAALLLCLTAKRTIEIRSLRWNHFEADRQGRMIQTTPGGGMKMRRRHRVPMSRQAMDIIENMRVVLPGDDLVFARPKTVSGMLSENTILNYLKSFRTQITAHGMRASFKTWALVHGYKPLAIEFALAHVQDQLEEAYMRDDLLEQRAALMQDWADFITKGKSLRMTFG